MDKSIVVGLLLGLSWIGLFALLHGLLGAVPTVRVPRTKRYLPLDVVLGTLLAVIGVTTKTYSLVIGGSFLLAYFISGHAALFGQNVRHGCGRGLDAPYMNWPKSNKGGDV